MALSACARVTACVWLSAIATGCSAPNIVKLQGPGIIAVGDHPFSAVPVGNGSLLVSLARGTEAAGGISLVRSDGTVQHLSLRTDGQPAGLAVSHDGRMVALAAYRETLLLDRGRLLSGRLDAVIARVREQKGAFYVAFSPDDHLLAISEEEAGRVMLLPLDRQDGTPQEVDVGRAPVGLAFSPDGHLLYVASEIDRAGDGGCPTAVGNGSVAPGTVSTIALDDEGGARLESVARVGCSPVRILLSPDGGRVFISLRGQDAVGVYRTKALRVGNGHPDTLTSVGSAPVGLALSADGTILRVANSNRFDEDRPGSISCLTVTPDGHLVPAGTAVSGVFPRELSLLPDGRMAATVYGDGVLQILPPRC